MKELLFLFFVLLSLLLSLYSNFSYYINLPQDEKKKNKIKYGIIFIFSIFLILLNIIWIIKELF